MRFSSPGVPPGPHPCLACGDRSPTGEGCDRAGSSCRYEVRVLQPLLHCTQEKWWVTTDLGSASFESEPSQATVQDAHAENAFFECVRPRDWFAAIDLKDAYFHVSILPRHRPFLRFAFEGRAYQYKVLPFGLALSPRVFTKVVEGALVPMREQGIRILNYLDDWLSLGNSYANTGIWCSVTSASWAFRSTGKRANSPQCRGSLFSVWSWIRSNLVAGCIGLHQEGRGPAGVFGWRIVPRVRAGWRPRATESPAWLCAQGSYHSLQGPGSEPASAAPGGGRPSPGFTLSSSRLATIHRQNSKPQDLRPALCLLRRPAKGKGCLQAEDGPLDSGCHCLGLPSSRRALPAQVACPLYERRGILLCVGSWRLADRYL